MSNQQHPNEPRANNPQGNPQAQRPDPKREAERAEYLSEQYGFTPGQINVVRNAICVGATDAELEFFLATCKRVALDPFARQIWFVKRRQKIEDSQGNEQWVDVGKPETSIDGLRTIAERSGEYEGQAPMVWCGPDGKWVDVWLKDGPPAAARATIYRHGLREPMIAVALFTEFCPTYKNGGMPAMWKKMGANQLAKCAESAAFRRAFPRDLSGMVTDTEMEHVVASSSYSTPAAPAKVETAPQPQLEARKPIDAISELKPQPDREPVPATVRTSADPTDGRDLAGAPDELDRELVILADELNAATDRDGLARVGAICSQAKGRTDAYSLAVLELVTPLLQKRWRELVPAPVKGKR